jgi:3-oxoacyl-(acyl-carrier-protein) synthase
MDAISRMTACAVALALKDAGIEYSPAKKQDVGIIGTNAEGSLCSDLEYYKDYIKSGRTLSRGNLFIYTLPSSPLGESAIHFGFLGPLLYATGGPSDLALVLDTAADMIRGGETPVMLAGKAEEDAAVYMVLDGNEGPAATVLCDEATLREIVESNPALTGLVQNLEDVAARKA